LAQYFSQSQKDSKFTKLIVTVLFTTKSYSQCQIDRCAYICLFLVTKLLTATTSSESLSETHHPTSPFGMADLGPSQSGLVSGFQPGFYPAAFEIVGWNARAGFNVNYY
jgi:hypothetical protein